MPKKAPDKRPSPTTLVNRADTSDAGESVVRPIEISITPKTATMIAPMVGALILQHWGFNKEFIEMVRCRKQWQRDTGKKADLGDLLLIARIHASIGHEDFTDCPSIPDIPAYYKFPLGKLTPDQSLEILAEAGDELDELQQMFG